MKADVRQILVIGGGFYGCALSVFLRRHRHEVVIYETGNDLMLRASYVNQARVHNGYHYPRSFITAWRSLVNFPRFVLDFRASVDSSFKKVYAIARRGSKVNAYQFKRFCQNIGAPVQSAPQTIRRLFSTDLIEDVFVVRELAFNAAILRDLMRNKLQRLGVPVHYQRTVRAVEQAAGDRVRVIFTDGQVAEADTVFVCTYAQINTLLAESGLPLLPMKHEVTELALIEPPEQLRHLGITVMDGAFFSTMPFPALGLHSLSHVRYTPHESWVDMADGFRNPYQYLAGRAIDSHALYMIQDSRRYLPALEQAKYKRSLFDIKTVLVRNELDDGRPILCQEDYGLKNLYLVMGGKIDNIYDVLKYLGHFATIVDDAPFGGEA